MKIFDKLNSDFKKNKEYQQIFLHILYSLVYSSWSFLTYQIEKQNPIDNIRHYSIFLAIALSVFLYYKIIKTGISNLILQGFFTTQLAYLTYLNHYSNYFIFGFSLILVLQSITFLKRKYLSIFYGYSLILSIVLLSHAESNHLLFIYNVGTVLLLAYLTGLYRIKGSEIILKQKVSLLELQIDHLNSKISQNLINLGSALTHEINTPLMTIAGHAEILSLQSKNDSSISVKSIDKIRDQVENIKEITKMLGYLSADPKKNEVSYSTASNVQSDIKLHIEKRMVASKIKINFNESYNNYEISPGKMFYIMTEIIKLFPYKKDEVVEINIIFENYDIHVFSDKPYTPTSVDLNSTSMKVVANSCNYDIYPYETKKSIGFSIMKEMIGKAI